MLRLAKYFAFFFEAVEIRATSVVPIYSSGRYFIQLFMDCFRRKTLVWFVEKYLKQYKLEEQPPLKRNIGQGQVYINLKQELYQNTMVRDIVFFYTDCICKCWTVNLTKCSFQTKVYLKTTRQHRFCLSVVTHPLFLFSWFYKLSFWKT